MDIVFDRRRSTAEYEWLYLENPNGIARCTLAFERSSGKLISNLSRFPWPVARGSTPLKGEFGGDSVTLPRLQRQGILGLRREFSESHPWHHSTIKLAIPNYKSRAETIKYGRVPAMGPLPLATMVIRWDDYLHSHSIRKNVANAVGRTANFAFDAWHRAALGSFSNLRIEQITRFDSSIDSLTGSWMRTTNYWCPRDAAFLNWRYFKHPLHSYLACGVFVEDEIKGYSVIQQKGERAMMMEFAAPETPKDLGRALLRGIVDAARDAGCNAIDFHSTANWRFWNLFRRAGFIRHKSELYFSARCPDLTDVGLEENWQLLPGDSDAT